MLCIRETAVAMLSASLREWKGGGLTACLLTWKDTEAMASCHAK